MGATNLFADVMDSNFTRYRVSLQVIEKLIGGVPKDPDTIKKWLAARLEMEDRAIIELAEETAALMQEASGARPSAEELLTAVATEFAGGNGFKYIAEDSKLGKELGISGLVYEGRCAKAALKEAANVAYPGTAWPSKPAGVKKGLMNYLAERVFVEENYISLGLHMPSGNEQRIKHIKTPQGPRSAISVVDFVDQPLVTFHVRVSDDFLSQKEWGRLWEHAENIGIGADRSRSDGKFELVEWTKLKGDED